MDIWESKKLLLFMVFVIPGFISLKAYSILIPSAQKDSSQQLIDAVAYSCINYAILLLPIYLVESSSLPINWPSLYVAFYLLVLLVAPVSWAFVLRWLRTTQFMQRLLPHPTGKPWDFVFGQRQRYWILVTLKTGGKIGGYYDSKSFASSAPQPEQLYLQQHWVVNDDNGLERAKIDTAGILILSTEIVSVEFFNVVEGGSNDRPQEHK